MEIQSPGQALMKKKLHPSARIGIVNRGEPAVRFIRAVKEFNDHQGTNLTTVAFYLPIEEEALFVREAHDAYALTKLPNITNKGSDYLNRELMLTALTKANCDAIWPGWGFLSEDAEFVSLVEKSGRVFLGPSAKAMALLGNKIEAKKLADKAKVPILPWSEKPVTSIEQAQKVAKKIGYPIIIKAANAGGGRGIRFVRTAKELKSQFESARDETIRITGDDILFIECLVEESRHLEVQAIVDRHGNINTFGVRDCSIQRRNQKIIEETPPPHFTEKQIASVEKSAANLMKIAGYESAGTVEFIYDMKREKFYFMEVNTRLQVEHPITEQLYQIDLVQAQLAIAMGQKWKNNASPRGCTIEVRLNAEDPERDFTPAPGKVTLFQIPSGPGIRVDSGIEAGSSISMEFDSMVAKIICYAATRKEALARLRRALSEMRIKIEGGTTNRAFLLELLDLPQVCEGKVHTKFVEAFLAKKERKQVQSYWNIALLACVLEQYASRYMEELANFKHQFTRLGYLRSISNATGYEIELSLHGHNYNFMVRAIGYFFQVTIDGQCLILSYLWRGHERVLIYGGKRYNIQIVERGDLVVYEVNGIPHSLEMESKGTVKAPSPAMVIGISAQVGQTVEKGDLLLTLEAMKMEMAICALQPGVLKTIYVQEGEQVAAGQSLVSVDAKGQEKVEISAPRVSFALSEDTLMDKPERVAYEWEVLEAEYLAVFLGYDCDSKSTKILDALIEFANKYKKYRSKLVKTILKALEIYISIEELFSSEQLHSEGSARAMNSQELLMHFFRRAWDRESGLSETFLARLDRAIGWYALRGLGQKREATNRGIFRIYKSHVNLPHKQQLLRVTLFALKEMKSLKIDVEDQKWLGDLLDDIVRLTQVQNPSLVDAVIYARYYLLDRKQLQQSRELNRNKMLLIIDSLVTSSLNARESKEAIQKIINAGNYITYDLFQFALDKSKAKRNLGLELLAKRYNRDRQVHSGKVVYHNKILLYHLTCKKSSGGQHSVVAVLSKTNPLAKLKDVFDYLKQTKFSQPPEVILLIPVQEKNEQKERNFVKRLPSPPCSVSYLNMGFFAEDTTRSYYNLIVKNNKWQQDPTRYCFNPLNYRELRIFRLGNFKLKKIYQSESVYLVEGTDYNNDQDKRLFALVTVSETEPEFYQNNSIQSIPTFEHAVTEAIHTIRTHQVNSKRLHWNRIIIHNRSLIDTNLDQLQNYARKLNPRFSGLGLEKVVIYTLAKSKEKNSREIELLFENSGFQITLRGRVPSQTLLEPMDKYAAKVIKCRRRKVVYPYEIIKMITRPGHSTEKFPRGEFKEYDLQHNSKTGKYQLRKTNKREYGKNVNNIIFGIITNFSKYNSKGLKRVIILGDPTRDMGSLAEQECRRVNAALDLAQKEDLPVEWIPISSGARIDMSSGTENLDWTANTLKSIIEFTQNGGEINIIVAGTNVGAQSYWNAEATMLMHTKGLLIMTDEASMLLTGKKALDFSGSVSAENNIGIGGAERIMGPNGQAQIWVKDLSSAYKILFRHYEVTYSSPGQRFPLRSKTKDSYERDICVYPYEDKLGQNFTTIGDIFSLEHNPERKKPFDMRQVMKAIIDKDFGYFERWQYMTDAETAIIWETKLGGFSVGMIGIESRPLTRLGPLSNDGPESWSGGTLFPKSSKKVARGINAYSNKIPIVIIANLSGFDGSPESLRNCQLEYGAEIGRAVVNFKGPIVFVVVARYHGGAYVVFSKTLNPYLKSVALEGTYASVIGGAPAAAVVFPKKVRNNVYQDSRIVEAQKQLKTDKNFYQKDFDELFAKVYAEHQTAFGQDFDQIHSVKRARDVGSIHEIISAHELRPYLIQSVTEGIEKYLQDHS